MLLCTLQVIDNVLLYNVHFKIIISQSAMPVDDSTSKNVERHRERNRNHRDQEERRGHHCHESSTSSTGGETTNSPTGQDSSSTDSTSPPPPSSAGPNPNSSPISGIDARRGKNVQKATLVPAPTTSTDNGKTTSRKCCPTGPTEKTTKKENAKIPTSKPTTKKN